MTFPIHSRYKVLFTFIRYQIFITQLCDTIKGFQVTSQQVNFASHLFATAMLVSCRHRSVWQNTTKCHRTFYLVHVTMPNFKRVTRILEHTFFQFQILLQSKKKKKKNSVFCCLSVYREEKSCAYSCVLPHANPFLSVARSWFHSLLRMVPPSQLCSVLT